MGYILPCLIIGHLGIQYLMLKVSILVFFIGVMDKKLYEEEIES
jgi:hypothetical protein